MSEDFLESLLAGKDVNVVEKQSFDKGNGLCVMVRRSTGEAAMLQLVDAQLLSATPVTASFSFSISGAAKSWEEAVEKLVKEASSSTKNLDPTAWTLQTFRMAPLPSYRHIVSRSYVAENDKRKLYLHTQLRLREAEYTDAHKLTVLVATWNVNGKNPSEGLEAWLLRPPYLADIVATGLQEFDTSKSALILSETAKVEPWLAAMLLVLNQTPSVQYVLVAKQQLGGILEAIFVRSELAPFVKDVQISYATTGIGNVLANKGGTAVRMDVYDSSFCFVCSHLNAHDERVLRRNQDFASIAHDVRFPEQRSIWDHQFLFWYGDLNYRIALPRPRIFALIKASNWGELVANDQLNVQRRLGAAFAEFNEGKIAWAPTYRFDNGTDTYDTSEKQRKPSYTDRVLFRASNSADLKLLQYESVPSLMLSDHKPVVGVFSAVARSIRDDDYAATVASIQRDVDRLENDFQPQASLSATEFDFQEVRYGVPSVKTLVLRNVGVVLFRWCFVPHPGHEVCKSWVRLEPSSGTLMPNEEALISFVVLVEGTGVESKLGLGKTEMDDILILRLEQGKDYYVSLRGRYMQSSFGCPLESLVRLVEPVRTASLLLKPEESLRIPKELWTLSDWMYRNGLSEPDVFLQRGIPEEMATLRECLDTGESFPENVSAYSVAETMLDFLRSLTQPVIPIVYYGQATDSEQNSIYKQIVEVLPEVNFNVFNYVIAFGKELLDEKKHHSGVTADELALAFGNVLLRAPNEARYKKQNVAEQHEQLRKRFVARFLVDRK